MDDWIEVFTKYFTDEQLLRESYVFSHWSDGTHCKLCDARIVDTPEAHLRQHRRELRAWRRQRDRANERAARKRLAEARRLRAEARV